MMHVPSTVTHLYETASVTTFLGIEDYTEGIYEYPSQEYKTAKKNQHTYLLDEINAREGFRLLDVGCGLGTLLETARERGVQGKGITISEYQYTVCKAKGLDVYLHDYRKLPPEWNHTFDGIIANGSLEHFCQPEDAENALQNIIYCRMFRIFSELLDPHSQHQKLATTAIHFSQSHIPPKKFVRNPLLQIYDPVGFNASILHRGYGGYYPIQGQLEFCAREYFELEKEIDGTEDYRITSEYWCKQLTHALFHNRRFARTLAGFFKKRPLHTLYVLASFVGIEAWPWQFRGKNPPARLYRQTWRRAFQNTLTSHNPS
jgi:cyclopropane fatty-acyl-phospholipid synthase-like methyltransferase